MNYTLKYFFITIFLISFYACSDDSGTDPSDEFVGATFQFQDGQILTYNSYRMENGDSLLNGTYYQKLEESDNYKGKKSFKIYTSLNEERLDSVNFTYLSTTEDGYYMYLNELYDEYEFYFDELNTRWVKYIDFKTNSWTQFDLEKDSILSNGDKFYASFKLYGEWLENLDIEYKNESHFASKYIIHYEAETIINGKNTDLESRSIEFIVIDNIGIYKTKNYNEGVELNSFRILMDNR